MHNCNCGAHPCEPGRSTDRDIAEESIKYLKRMKAAWVVNIKVFHRMALSLAIKAIEENQSLREESKRWKDLYASECEKRRK